MAIMAATVWFIPGWLRTAEPHEGIMECVSNAFPEANVEFKAWDGDNILWPLSVDSADKEAWRFAFEIAMMPPEARANLTLVGHSLGGRITARVLARLAEHGLKVRQAILMGAAIPVNDPDLAKMGRASELPVLAVCNPKDLRLCDHRRRGLGCVRRERHADAVRERRRVHGADEHHARG